MRTASRRLAAVVFAVAALASAAALTVPSSPWGAVDVDEPQYLLTALSLAEDGDLDIADELAEQRWRGFDVQEGARLPQQTEVRPGGAQVSPHDPLLPLLLALPVRLGGWVGAKVTLALFAGTAAAMTFLVATRRLGVAPRPAAAGVAVAFASAPLAVYGAQVYPEMPAAVAVLAAVGALLGRLSPRDIAVAGAGVVALPWLSVKYVPVAAALAGLTVHALVRSRRFAAAGVLLAALAGHGGAYLLLHRSLYGGWTAYASGDHFRTAGEFAVMGVDPDYVGRSLRLVALFADRSFGLVAWQPAWLLVVPAAAALARRRPPGAASLLVPLAAGWATATWLALTMHGFWFPGRQLVAVLPLAGLVILWRLQHAGAGLRAAAGLAGGLGVLTYAALLRDGWSGRLTWVFDVGDVRSPAATLARALLPDYSAPDFWQRHASAHVAAAGVLVALVLAGWFRTGGLPLPAPSERNNR